MADGFNAERCMYGAQEHLAAISEKTRELMAENYRLRTSITAALAVAPDRLTYNTAVLDSNGRLRERIKAAANGKKSNMLDVLTYLPPRWHVGKCMEKVLAETMKHIPVEELLRTPVSGEDLHMQTFHDSILGCLDEQGDLQDVGFSGEASAALKHILQGDVPESFRNNSTPSATWSTALSSIAEQAATALTSLPHLEFVASNLESLGASLDGRSNPIIWQDCASGLGDSDLQGVGNNEVVRTTPLPVGLVQRSTIHSSASSSSNMFPSSLHDEALNNHADVSHQIQLTTDVTLFIRNIPARFTAATLMDIWPPRDVYNILHLPYDHTSKRTKGIAFVNFVSDDAAENFWERCEGKSLVDSGTCLHITYARIQGFHANINNMKRSKRIMALRNENHLPVVLRSDGTRIDFRDVMST